MFSFYGSKQKIVKYYPDPIHDTIVEPFCGSARYSLLHYYKNVILTDSYEPIVAVWDYLINHATSKMIMSLPDVSNATKLESIKGFTQLSQPEKWLIGFCSNGGSAQPKNVSGRHNFNSWNRDKNRIAESLSKIRHWKVSRASYDENRDIVATWFIDPPYVDKGKWYPHHDIDYGSLAEWCKSRKGQVMVCEQAGATWLDFIPLVEIPFSHFKTEEDKKKKTTEVMWYNLLGTYC